MSHATLARRVFDIETAALRAVRGALDDAFDRAVDLVCATLAARRKLLVLGIGKSGNIGRKLAATLSSTGTSAALPRLATSRSRRCPTRCDHWSLTSV